MRVDAGATTATPPPVRVPTWAAALIPAGTTTPAAREDGSTRLGLDSAVGVGDDTATSQSAGRCPVGGDAGWRQSGGVDRDLVERPNEHEGVVDASADPDRLRAGRCPKRRVVEQDGRRGHQAIHVERHSGRRSGAVVGGHDVMPHPVAVGSRVRIDGDRARGIRADEVEPDAPAALRAGEEVQFPAPIGSPRGFKVADDGLVGRVRRREPRLNRERRGAREVEVGVIGNLDVVVATERDRGIADDGPGRAVAGAARIRAGMCACLVSGSRSRRLAQPPVRDWAVSQDRRWVRTGGAARGVLASDRDGNSATREDGSTRAYLQRGGDEPPEALLRLR